MERRKILSEILPFGCGGQMTQVRYYVNDGVLWRCPSHKPVLSKQAHFYDLDVVRGQQALSMEKGRALLGSKARALLLWASIDMPDVSDPSKVTEFVFKYLPLACLSLGLLDSTWNSKTALGSHITAILQHRYFLDADWWLVQNPVRLGGAGTRVVAEKFTNSSLVVNEGFLRAKETPCNDMAKPSRPESVSTQPYACAMEHKLVLFSNQEINRERNVLTIASSIGAK
ncbi:hypothetical protein ANN_07408 [Periplaneta americana]|uniref:Uncharacterized protein n=1 Tax=Periplaneta americana TaxID=6978 RepID=A0ABQ8SYI7_PERAM|nr:hypothetical protein ANN_07408 [Periplaneta americana]